MIFSLENKTAIVTGGASGIGKAITHLFVKQGALVYLFDNNKEAIHETIQEVDDKEKVKGVQCDISTPQLVSDLVSEIKKERSYIHILVNNAGIPKIGNIENTSEADMDRLFAVNVKGVFNCMKAVIPGMKQHGGAIVNMASVASSTGLKDRFAYSMTKGAVVTMTLSVAKDYLQHKIRCNSISPARVHTPFVENFLAENYPGKEKEMFEALSKTQPIGRMGTPEEIAFLALYLCSDEAGFVTGCDYPIDGGFIKLNN